MEAWGGQMESRRVLDRSMDVAARLGEELEGGRTVVIPSGRD